METIKLKNVITEIKEPQRTMEEQRKKKISELEEIAVEIIQPEKQRENRREKI